jgi:hypothetical protein
VKKLLSNRWLIVSMGRVEGPGFRVIKAVLSEEVKSGQQLL